MGGVPNGAEATLPCPLPSRQDSAREALGSSTKVAPPWRGTRRGAPLRSRGFHSLQGEEGLRKRMSTATYTEPDDATCLALLAPCAFCAADSEEPYADPAGPPPALCPLLRPNECTSRAPAAGLQGEQPGIDTSEGSCGLGCATGAASSFSHCSGEHNQSGSVEAAGGKEDVFIPGVLGEAVGYRYALGGILVYYEGCRAERATGWVGGGKNEEIQRHSESCLFLFPRGVPLMQTGTSLLLAPPC